LIIDGTPVADYRQGDELPESLSPRPFLHPVRTRSGVVLTAEQPPDHRHHLGLSLAVADVDGTDFWGGRTFVAGRGSVPLDNHGRQRRRTVHADPGAIEEELVWTGPDGAELIIERRTITARPMGSDSWVLDWSSDLNAPRELRIASPAVNGRPGAGYGGIFWRFPAEGKTEVSSPLGDGAEVIHGHRATWLVIRHTGPDEGSGTVILTEPGSRDPWFVRDGGYVGCGPAPATDEPVRLDAGERLRCGLTAVIIDGWHTDPEFLIDTLVRAGDA
jgi:hypothetical protein